ncbi:MAG TPA: ABC transporter ATP-binding protein [Candidatus Fermentibacter sp.]|nr:ABC transporter ATP-binding protein [Candidatus Fermentibacter sp.]
MDPVLRVEGLSKRYPRQSGLGSFQAVSDVSFELEPGGILGFLGPNGAGKTTTMKCILGLLAPSSGRIGVFGRPPASREARRRMGYIPENPDYEDSFTPEEYLSFFASMRHIPWSRGDSARMLGRVGLENWGRARIRRLSKGMRQKLSLALALQGSPELLVMDEPTGGFDPLARKEFRDMILEENARGAACFLSSHILSDIETICSRALILAGGRVVREGSMSELLSSQNRHRISYRKPGAGNAEELVELADLQAAIDRIRSSGGEIEAVGREILSLEEVFLSATSGGEAR